MLPARYLQATTRPISRSTRFSGRRPRRCYTTSNSPPPKSAHSSLYSSTFPAMIPVFLLGSAIFLGLQLTQLNLSHEKHMEEAKERVQKLEAEIDALQKQRADQLESPPKGSISSSSTPQSGQTKSSWRWW